MRRSVWVSEAFICKVLWVLSIYISIYIYQYEYVNAIPFLFLQGGDTNNLTESTVLGLFVSGYEKKPSLIFPIEVVKSSNIPEELRSSAVEQGRDLSSDTLLKDSDLHEVKLVFTLLSLWFWLNIDTLKKERKIHQVPFLSQRHRMIHSVMIKS